MTAPKFYVEINRTDGSRSYKGSWVESHAQREADSWTESFPQYDVRLVPAADKTVRADVRRFDKATREVPGIGSARYYPVDG